MAVPKGVLLLSTYEVNVALTPGKVLLLTKNVAGPEPSKPVLVYLRVRVPPVAVFKTEVHIDARGRRNSARAIHRSHRKCSDRSGPDNETRGATFTAWVLQEAGVQAPLKT